ERRQVVGGLAGEDRFGRASVEWGATEQREVRRRGERVQVRALVDALAQELLRRRELRRAAARGGTAEPAVATQRQGQSEIGDAQPPVGLDQHVLRLQVPV